jgi:hypothetical protein
MEGESKKHGFFMLAEMVLIIVGITAALQLDNWTSNSEDRRNERALLEQLQGEFKQVKSVIDANFIKLNEIDEKSIMLYQACGIEQVNMPDSVVLSAIVKAFTNNQITLYQGVLEDAINTGKLSLIVNDELRILLYAWKNGVLEVQAFIDRTSEDTSVFYRYLYEYISFRSFDDIAYPELQIGESEFNMNPNNVFSDIMFENQVGVVFYRNRSLIKQYNSKLLAPSERIMNLLEEELKKSALNEPS